ncbi:MAG TPA: DUF411 domain-containing protein [Actinomycetota bacterium]|nr:DUF411 domain-containing protein [Actinomycetota bacterium]
MVRRIRWMAALGLAAALAAACDARPDVTPTATGTGATTPTAASTPAAGPTITVYASPGCGCCHRYIPYLRAHGFAVREVRADDVTAVKVDLGVPEEAWSCHTATVGRYVIEGHVPVEAIERLLAERPAVDGIALPGMPAGAPGMDGEKAAPFEIVAFRDGRVVPFMTV